MSKPRFIETIKVKDGSFCNLSLHSRRAIRTSEIHFGVSLNFDIPTDIIPMDMRIGIVKCRILYSDTVESITFEPYRFRPINNLALVYDNDIDYTYKSEDRSRLQSLVSQKGNCDEILIVKNGYITDTSYSNIVLENNEGLFTPSTPLLAGIKRQLLIDAGTIIEKYIRVDDLHRYSRAYLINAMIDLDDNVGVSSTNVF
ncbi:aminotransferase class IV [Dysgonomonas capnocytophagoides]|uniref:aminotransferase class IV n=1 Tax=Dysgonomonas capnocytophagoides TaxID=45254 RepID=UPI00291D5C30|nr:aminotransferase class IV family protein [Dysgonomonas capnocytophagoides]